MNSPSSVQQEDSLHRFLEQRAARADIRHTRFPSLTEFSDSPSIYSHSHFSPRPPHLDSSPPQFDFVIPPQYAQPSFGAVTSLANSNTDMHTLNTDCASPTTDIRFERSPSPESIHAEDEEPELRLSFLGPTMRFHSPAPWETEDSIGEGPEQEDDARSFVTKRSRSKPRGEGLLKGFAKAAPTKVTSITRPSIESTSGRDKVSFDSYISSTNLQAQPQTTVPATSPAASSSRPSRPGLFSRGRSRTVSHTATPETSIPPQPPLSPSLGSTYASATSPVPTRSTSPDPSMYSSTYSQTDVTDASRPTSPLSLRGRTEFVHPYANPDLAYEAGPVHTTTSFLPSSSLGRRMFVPSDSIATVSESGVSQSSSTLTPDSSMSSVNDYHTDVIIKKVVGSVQGKVISSPMPTIAGQQGPIFGSQPGQEKGQLALPNHVPGWTELSVSPTFNLISLQEAQAQARERSRTQTQVMPEPPFLQTPPPSRNNPTLPPSNTGRLRSRTASVGSKAKAEPLVISNPLPLSHSGAEDSAPTIGSTGSLPRSLKHKKSGFMRLFNGKDKEKPITQSPTSAPPVVSISNPRTPKISSARVPVPTLSSSLVSQSPLQLDSIVKGDGGENDSVDDFQDRGSIKRQGTALSIVTQDALSSPAPTSSQSANAGIGSTLLTSGSRSVGLSPASAPPSTTTFPGLSLRPVSTVFSAHFADHIVSVGSPSTPRTDSSSTAVGGSSSLSSPSTKRPSDERQATEDDPYTIIQQLQEQMKSTRKAWQHQIWELEGQVRDLRAEIDGMRLKELSGERCILCGRTDEQDRDSVEAPKSTESTESRHGVVNRPRARTGVGTRFGSAT